MRAYAKDAQLSKDAFRDCRKQLNGQREAFQLERHHHALINRALEFESARRADMEGCVKFERSIVQKLSEVIHKLELPEGKVPDDDSLGFFWEWQLSQSEVRHLRDQLQHTIEDLEHKKLVLRDVLAVNEKQNRIGKTA